MGFTQLFIVILFQSTLPYGSDKTCTCWRFNSRISIHAPLRERLMLKALWVLIITFQSTLPYGSDRVCRFAFQRPRYFNPRSLTGATLGYTLQHNGQIDFNPRSLTGATFITPLFILFILFQSTLPYGSDNYYPVIRIHIRNFNPRSLTGATAQFALLSYHAKFQSTLPYGSDQILYHPLHYLEHFNPRSLTGATL